MSPQLSALLISFSYTILTNSARASQTFPPSSPTPAFAAIIRGGVVLSPVSSTQPWSSKASAGPWRPLSLRLTLPSLPHSTSLTFTLICAPFCLLWPSGSYSCCPIIQSITPLLLLQLKLTSSDSRPSPRALAPWPLCLCCRQHGWTYPRARCGPMWQACPEYRLSALITAIDFYSNLLP